jgi:hypothetical protein
VPQRRPPRQEPAVDRRGGETPKSRTPRKLRGPNPNLSPSKGATSAASGYLKSSWLGEFRWEMRAQLGDRRGELRPRVAGRRGARLVRRRAFHAPSRRPMPRRPATRGPPIPHSPCPLRHA